ncbi:A/G-specific adenine glycosylase [Paenibacillus puerhi]|uniref:A/G-specific adenine glycosylase n=1 Tax=Paenibacillus puerhi TaxID=2692622 RepID=UPI001357A5A7|nr:A/G-specific adenine glycosylase [Paenibacillus puerhi]
MERIEQQRYFSSELLAWYRRHKRDLPWRRSRNPYFIWVSEIMLQQTRVDTVIPYFHRFIDKFPTVRALAEAPEDEVLKAWEGLGYYSRARNLQSAVREVHERYGGVVPDSKEAVSALKGVGPYTTGAILSIAYDKPEPAVDGNVMRVLSRYFLLEDDIMKPRTRLKMESLAKELIPEGEASDFNQALMELGALVCTPKSPHCLTCPVMACCDGRAAGREETLPVKTKAKPPRPEARAALLLEGVGEHAGKLLIRQRPAEGLLARMWELPHAALPEGSASGAEGLPSAHGALAAHVAGDGIGISGLTWLMQAEHTFSHIRWTMDVFTAKPEALSLSSASGTGLLPSHYRWIGPDDREDHAFPNVFIRILDAYFESKAAVSP